VPRSDPARRNHQSDMTTGHGRLSLSKCLLRWIQSLTVERIVMTTGLHVADVTRIRQALVGYVYGDSTSGCSAICGLGQTGVPEDIRVVALQHQQVDAR
jgi:hypothetical protein